MALELYWQKRNFRNTPEPRGKVRRSGGRDLRFVIQKHRASHLHYDFRLELDGVLLSWAVPKGPSLDPREKRLAMHVEDHPIEYGDFEGVIPPGQYGSGTVMLWDRGRWMPEDDDPRAAYRKGTMKFSLEGEKLRGSWALVRTHWKGRDERSWLLIKHDDEFAQAGSESALVDEEDRSVVSGRDLDEIAAAKDAQWSGRKSVAANVKAGALKRSATNLDPARLDGAHKAKMPAMIGAQLCTLVKQVPAGDEWLHVLAGEGRPHAVGHRDRTRIEQDHGAPSPCPDRSEVATRRATCSHARSWPSESRHTAAQRSSGSWLAPGSTGAMQLGSSCSSELMRRETARACAAREVWLILDSLLAHSRLTPGVDRYAAGRSRWIVSSTSPSSCVTLRGLRGSGLETTVPVPSRRGPLRARGR